MSAPARWQVEAIKAADALAGAILNRDEDEAYVLASKYRKLRTDAANELAREAGAVSAPERPWSVAASGVVIDADGELVVSVPRPKGAGATAKRDARRALIALAPELAADMERAERVLGSGDGLPDGCENTYAERVGCALGILRSALSRLPGGAS